jgi:hypothetical protein
MTATFEKRANPVIKPMTVETIPQTAFAAGGSVPSILARQFPVAAGQGRLSMVSAF